MSLKGRERNMKGIYIKDKEEKWPKMVLKNMNFIIFYVGEREEDVKVKEMRKMDFRDLLKNLKNGKSVFITTRPRRRVRPGDISRWL
jgi:uncharacterized membrane-anchored protein